MDIKDPEAGKPYLYRTHVDIRFIVIVYDRSQSLEKCLNSLQNMNLGSSTGEVHIWIDKSNVDNSIPQQTLQVAKKFKWKHGSVMVHV
jgi:hypothetical protein